jgi:hypothetical protein
MKMLFQQHIIKYNECVYLFRMHIIPIRGGGGWVGVDYEHKQDQFRFWITHNLRIS